MCSHFPLFINYQTLKSPNKFIKNISFPIASLSLLRLHLKNNHKRLLNLLLSALFLIILSIFQIANDFGKIERPKFR